MKNTLGLFILLAMAACSQDKHQQAEIPIRKQLKSAAVDSHLVLLKDYALCKCIENATAQFKVKDVDEVSTRSALIRMEINGIYHKKVSPLLDSIIYAQVLKQQIAIKSDKDSTYVAEGSVGKTAYIYSCLEFCRSAKLDSFLKSIPKNDYWEPF